MARLLTQVERRRTAFPYLPGGENEKCPYCKNDKTDRVVDKPYLVAFKSAYKTRRFEVRECACCSAVFSFEVPLV